MKKVLYILLIVISFFSFNLVKARCIYEKDGNEYELTIKDEYTAYINNEDIPITKTNYNYIVDEGKCYKTIFRCNKSWGFDESDSVNSYCSNAIIYTLKEEVNNKTSIVVIVLPLAILALGICLFVKKM